MTVQFNNSRPVTRKPIAPILALICLAIMLLLNWLWPLTDIFRFPFNLAGLLLLGGGLTIGLVAQRQFEKIGANHHPFKDPTKLVTDGLFRYSRNPMYLGLTIFLAGIWVLLGSLSPLGIVVAFFLMADHWYVAYEEQRLDCIFCEAYAAYRARTRRWISFSLLIKEILTVTRYLRQNS